mmetsp:Transcript_83739/g.186960  ORF Transcript_83739/g.186960 Transcript_83739/m.186960 type:complete len:458 (-) Transcript_83739:193-1566(-)
MGSSCSGLLDREAAVKGNDGELCLCQNQAPRVETCDKAHFDESVNFVDPAVVYSNKSQASAKTSPTTALVSGDDSCTREGSFLAPLPDCGTCTGASASREAQGSESSEKSAARDTLGDPASPSAAFVTGTGKSTRFEDPDPADSTALAVHSSEDHGTSSRTSGRGPSQKGRTVNWRSRTSTVSNTSKQTTEDMKRRKSSRIGALLSTSRWAKQDTAQLRAAAGSSTVPRPRNYTNSNMPQDYRWLESVLESIVKNKAAALGCKDLSNGKAFLPVFFVLGACPNMFCGMQAVMYSVGTDGEVDFWWVKPGKSDAATGHVGVEENTLNRHAKGPYKNDPGRSKPFYKPLADLFKQEQVVGDVRFGIEQAASGAGARAFLEQASGGRQYMHLVWQEDWTSNPFSRSKYIKGKIVYQKDPEALKFYARQYAILNGSITVSNEEEPPFLSLLPPEDVKDLKD